MMRSCFNILLTAFCAILLVGAVGCRFRSAAPSNPASKKNHQAEPIISESVVEEFPYTEKPPRVKKPKTNFISDVDEYRKERRKWPRGATKETNNSVKNGLQWLAAHQNKDGSWDKNPGENSGDHSQKVAVTALALLAFFGEGYGERGPKYSQNVRRAVNWLMNDVDASSGRFRSARGMHEQALGTWALNEAYGMLVKRGKEKAVKATQFIIARQNSRGGWSFAIKDKKYFRGNWRGAPEINPVEIVPAPERPLTVGQKIGLALEGKCPDENFYKSGNTVVTCLQAQALKLAREVHLGINPEVDAALAKVRNWSEYVSTSEGHVGCTGPRDTSDSLVAAGAMIRMYTNFNRKDPILNGMIVRLKNNLPDKSKSAEKCFNAFACYFGTQICYHWGGQVWKDWDSAMKSTLISTQIKQGPDFGSWNPVGEWSQAWGRTGQTAWSLLCLETYWAYERYYK